MGEKSLIGITFLVLAVLAVSLFSGVIGYKLHPETKVVSVNVTRDVEKPVYVNVTKTIEVDTSEAFKDKAVLEFLKEIEDVDSLQICSGDQYDLEQIAVSKIYDGSTVSVDSTRTGDITTVNFEVRIKYSDKDVQDKCYRTFNVEAVFEDGEKTTLDY